MNISSEIYYVLYYNLLGDQPLDGFNVFVYGTLKPGEVNYARYCAGKVVKEQRAIAFGQLFDLPLGYPAMTPGESPVQGFLLTFADSSMLCILDELEDYNPQRTLEENEYYREQIEVHTLGGQSLGGAWVYLMRFELIQRWGGILLPSGWWSGCVDTLTP